MSVVRVVLLILLVALWFAVLCRSVLRKKRKRRGRTLSSPKKAQKIEANIRAEEGRSGLYWGGLELPESAATQHFLLVGTTGSGKTHLIHRLMKGVLPRVGVRPDHRAVIYDPKQDEISYLNALGLSCDIKIFNPFDERCVAWDMAADVTGPASALQVARILIPEDQGNNRFFSDAAYHLYSGVLLSFIQTKPGEWTFGDTLFAMKTKERLEAVLERNPQGRDPR